MPPPAADFPDPLDDAARAGPASTDDLIAKLADEAIDRMIAEDERTTLADDEKSALLDDEFEAALVPTAGRASVSPPSVAVPAAPVARPAPDSSDERAVYTSAREREQSAEAADFDAPDLTPSVRSFEPSDRRVVASTDAGPPEPSTTPDDVSAAAPEASTSERVVEAVPTVAPDLAALAAPPRAADAPPAPPADVRALLAAAPSAGVPVLLRPLEWFNFPFAGLPEAVRVALGQVGILTLLNAAAVIAYVLLFRR